MSKDTSSRPALVRDVVIGMSDGLTVPFALAAGLSGAVNSARVVVLAGRAELAAGTRARGLGGFLAAQGDAQHYTTVRLREERGDCGAQPGMKRRKFTRFSNSMGWSAWKARRYYQR